MKKREIFKYFRDIDNGPEEESRYDFSAVDLRGENHSNDEYDEFGEFAFDDDSHGVLPFDDDLELVEEDFALPDVTDDAELPDEEEMSDGTSVLDDDSFVLDKPDDAPDFTEDFLDIDDDEADDEEKSVDVPAAKLFPEEKKADDDLEPTVDIAEVPVVSVEPAVSRRLHPKVRNSALQPLLVINRSKHSFDPNKKKPSGQTDDSDTNDFENFDDGDAVDFGDGDIEDMSHDMSTENTLPETDVDEVVVPTDSDDVIAAENISVESDEMVGEVADEVAEDISDDSNDEFIGESHDKVITDEVIISEDTADSEPATDVEEKVDNNPIVPATEHIPAGRIFFDDFEDSENMFEEDEKPIFEPHIVQAMDVTQSAAEAIESAKNTGYDEEVAGKDDPEDEVDGDGVAEEVDEPEAETENPAKKPIDVRIKELRTARKKKKRKKKVKNFVKEIFGWIGLVFAAFFIAIVINLYVARPSVVSGRSMMPTLKNGDTIIISKVPYMLGEVKYGDIVVIDRQVNRERTFTVEVVESLKYNVLTQSLFDENELNEDIFWVKRVIGLPGDVIEFYEGKVYRNGELLDEGYIFTQEVMNYPDGEQFIVQEGCVFVMGDNRNESLDSRSLAMHDEQIAMDHIVGKLISK